MFAKNKQNSFHYSRFWSTVWSWRGSLYWRIFKYVHPSLKCHCNLCLPYSLPQKHFNSNSLAISTNILNFTHFNSRLNQVQTKKRKEKLWRVEDEWRVNCFSWLSVSERFSHETLRSTSVEVNCNLTGSINHRKISLRVVGIFIPRLIEKLDKTGKINRKRHVRWIHFPKFKMRYVEELISGHINRRVRRTLTVMVSWLHSVILHSLSSRRSNVSLVLCKWENRYASWSLYRKGQSSI